MHIKTTLRFHLTQVRMAILKGKKQQQMWPGLNKMEPLYTVGGNAN
jgi:hypothetical protein